MVFNFLIFIIWCMGNCNDGGHVHIPQKISLCTSWIMSGYFFVVAFSSDGCSACWHAGFCKMVFKESLMMRP